MSDYSIRVEEVSKLYRIGAMQTKSDQAGVSAWFRNVAFNPIKRIQSLIQNEMPEFAGESIWALKDVNLEISPGEVVGVIGHNGAGKSTLLKILSRITPPTEGRIHLRGRVASLLEVGTGFHKELTGRENVYLNGTILGMSKEEIDSKFDEIVEFAWISKYIDTPVKRYSSGMRVRLGFAVAAHLEPEILLVDEVLAVGDLAFQKKCLGKMDDIARSGRTVLLVSHNMSSVLGLCPRTVWIHGGQVAADGETKGVVQQYVENSLGKGSEAEFDAAEKRPGTGLIRISSFAVKNRNGDVLSAIPMGEDVDFVVGYQSDLDEVRNVRMKIRIRDQYGRLLTHFSTLPTAMDFSVLPPSGEVTCHIDRFPLTQGTYTLELVSIISGNMSDWIQQAGSIDVIDGNFFGTGMVFKREGEFLYPHSWSAHVPVETETS